MLDQIIGHLETGDAFEFNAKRLFESGTRPPDWAYTYIECLGDAARQRAAARRLAVSVHTHSSRVDSPDQIAGGGKQSGNIGDMTLGQLLRLADIARSAPGGSQRMRHAAQRMSQVAAILHTNGVLAQLSWWCVEIQPVPSGRPVLSLNEREASE